MVKNTHGGSGHKKFARKDAHSSASSSHRLRTAEVKGEVYAIVTKMCGNGMVHVHCVDNVLRLGHIRGKFTGRRKKDNFVSVGTWVMVGLRDGDDVAEKSTAPSSTTSKKLKQCDLLEVYSNSEKEQLKKSVTNVDWRILTSNDVSVTVSSEINNANDEGGGIIFTNQDDDDDDDLMPRNLPNKKATNVVVEQIVEKEMIDIDDI